MTEKEWACYLFGYKGLKESEALLIREYDRFVSRWPEEGFEQGPLWGLSYLMEGMAKADTQTAGRD